jgi:uncharacterized protein YkwD
MLAVAACATGRRAPPPIADQMAALQQRLFIIVEEKRHRLEPRAKPLMLDPQLVAAAQAHADAMAKAHAMDETPATENPAIRKLMSDPKFQGFVGENVAQQFYHADYGIEVNKFAGGFLQQWIDSPDQKRTLLFYGFNRVGIGIATDGKAIFVSQILATDLGLPPPPDEPDEEEEPAVPAPDAPPSPQAKPQAP